MRQHLKPLRGAAYSDEDVIAIACCGMHPERYPEQRSLAQMLSVCFDFRDLTGPHVSEELLEHRRSTLPTPRALPSE